MIISVHIPKTAGTSFAKTLQDIYKEKLFLDYNDAHITSAGQFFLARVKDRLANTRKKIIEAKIECIHGHFTPIKYRFYFPKARYIIWFRDPIKRLISYYNFLKNVDYEKVANDLKILAATNKLNKNTGKDIINLFKKNVTFRGLDEKDIPSFIANNKYSPNHYNRWLHGFNLDNFFFIGITEEYEKSIRLFGKMIHHKEELLTYRENIGAYTHKITQEIDPAIYKKLEKQNTFDVELYSYAKKRFANLCKQYNI